MSGRKGLTEKQLQEEATKIMDEGDDEVLSCISEEISEPFSYSGSSYAPSSPNSSSAEDLNSSDESVNNEGTAQEDVEEEVENNPDGKSNENDDEWVDIDSEPTMFEFTGQAGIKINIPSTSTVEEIFALIFDQSLKEKLCEWINLRAEIFRRNLTRYSTMKHWTPVDTNELCKFLGLCILMGNISMPCIKNYWSTNVLYSHPLFGNTMSRNRFESILRCLCFCKEDDDRTSRLHKISQVLDHISQNIQSILYPGANLSLDEALLLWRGRLLFRQYIPNKSAKYGIKLYELCTPDGFVLDILIYSGKGTVSQETSHAQSVVTTLARRYLGKGHTLFLDNYYNSVSLAEYLYKQKTHIVGTLRKDRKGNPKSVITAKLKKGQSVFQKKKNVLVLKWKDKRDVLVISTKHNAVFGRVTNKRGVELEKPEVILDYNKHMSGIDRSDQMVSYYTTPRKTVRWYLKVFFHLLDVCIWNSTYLYNKVQRRKITYLQFRELLILQYLKVNTNTRALPVKKPTYVQKPHYPKKIEKRKRCRVCSSKKKRTQSYFVCKDCKDKYGETVGLCVDPCFREYHESMI